MPAAALSDEVRMLCRRLLGDGPEADAAANAALVGGETDRVALLAVAAAACRSRVGGTEIVAGTTAVASEDGGGERLLAEAVAAELAAANAALPERQREALVLRERLRLGYAQIGTVMSLDIVAVAALLARARLMLRAALRGTEPEIGAAGCTGRERALRLLARRQDSESLTDVEDEWIRAHLGVCPACERAHAAMLEASVCYRAWGRS